MKNDSVLWACQIKPPSAKDFLHADWDSKLAMACHSEHQAAAAKVVLNL